MDSMLIALLIALATVSAKEITTNNVQMFDAPKWLTEAHVNNVVDKIQAMLEWDIRRVNVRWYTNAREFEHAHGLPVTRDATSTILAVSKKADNTVHLGPNVDAANFDGVFGHELGHIIMFQKYKAAIPQWLEEGLANWAARHGTIDYKYLASQPAVDVKTMGHPFGTGGPGPRYHYMASTALMEMIGSHCQIHDLLQLSVGEKLEGYLDTFCGISDLNAEFRKFVARKAGVSLTPVAPKRKK